MKIIEEADNYIKDYCNQRVLKKKQRLKTNRTDLNRLFCEALDALIIRQTEKQQNGQQEKICFLYLCRLESSNYTESYKVLMGMSNSMLYLDEDKVDVFWCPTPVFCGVKQDMETIRKWLKENKEDMEEKKLSEWKRKLLEDDWNIMKEQFCKLIEENFYRIADSALLTEEPFLALSGDYMEPLNIAWETQKEKGQGAV